jgi:hypothetical protein
VNYSLSGDSVVNTQPEANAWDIVLTRFYRYFPDFDVYYPSTGLFLNEDASVSILNAADSSTAADATLADTTEFTDSIAAIGTGWYKLDGPSIIPLDTIAYFLKLAGGEIHKMQVTFFESGFSGKGRLGIRKRLLTGTPDEEYTYDTLVMGSGYVNDVYFSMNADTKYQVERANWEIGFKTNVYTASIWANTISGVELYTWPGGDVEDWDPAVTTESVKGNSGISIYPLPASDILYVKGDFATQQPLKMTVYEVSGKQVMDRMIRAEKSNDPGIDVASLPEGIYILQLQNSDIQAVKRFIIRR